MLGKSTFGCSYIIIILSLQPLSRCTGIQKREAIDGDGSLQLHMVTKRSAPPPPIAQLNHSSSCLGGAARELMSIPETVCSRASTSERNVDCWTGARAGRYVYAHVLFLRTETEMWCSHNLVPWPSGVSLQH